MNHDPRASGLESRRAFLIGSAVLLCLAILLIAALRNPADYDGYWHLRMGMDWVRHGLSPWVDHYSFTFNGAPISGPPWAFQVALYGFVHLFGESAGMIVFKFVLFLLVFGCMILWLRFLQAPVAGYVAGLFLLTVGLELRAQVRPELVSYAFLIIALLLYQRSRRELTPRALGPALLLLVIWNNYHTAVFAYVVFFGLFVDIALRLVQERAAPGAWARWCAWGLAFLAAGFLRPGFEHPLLTLIDLAGDWSDLILEYTPPVAMLSSPAPYLLLPVAAIVLFALWRQRKVGLFVVTAIFTYGAVTMLRMVPPACVLYAALLPLVVRDMGTRTVGAVDAPGPSRGQERGVLLIAIAALLVGILYARAFMQENLRSWTRFPELIVEYMQETGMSGRIFNSYETGGFLAYHLAPDSQVFIDGRTNILYPRDHYLQYLGAKNDPRRFRAVAERYAFDAAVLGAAQGSARLMHEAGWTLDFVDYEYLLFTPEDGRLRHFGALWARPYCWDAELAAGLAAELAFLGAAANPGLPSTPLMQFSFGYTQVENRTGFLERPAAAYDYDDEGRRFLAGRAVAHGVFDTAISLATAIETRQPLDDLVPVVALGRQGRWPEATQAMLDALAVEWPALDAAQRARQTEILRWLLANAPASAATRALRMHAGDDDLETAFPDGPDHTAFCLP